MSFRIILPHLEKALRIKIYFQRNISTKFLSRNFQISFHLSYDMLKIAFKDITILFQILPVNIAPKSFPPKRMLKSHIERYHELLKLVFTIFKDITILFQILPVNIAPNHFRQNEC